MDADPGADEGNLVCEIEEVAGTQALGRLQLRGRLEQEDTLGEVRVPNWIGHSKNSPEYRFIAVRERLTEQPLPGMEAQVELPFPAMELSGRRWHKVFGVVTNRELAGHELIWWSRERCGKSLPST